MWMRNWLLNHYTLPYTQDRVHKYLVCMQAGAPWIGPLGRRGGKRVKERGEADGNRIVRSISSVLPYNFNFIERKNEICMCSFSQFYLRLWYLASIQYNLFVQSFSITWQDFELRIFCRQIKLPLGLCPNSCHDKNALFPASFSLFFLFKFNLIFDIPNY